MTVLPKMERTGVELGDVVAFLRVSETGSFARAAERLGLAKSIVSRRVARLETTLGARLLTRTARGAQPTELGRAYFKRAANSLAELEAAHEVVAEAMAEIAGPLRLTAPVSFGIEHLAPALAEFVTVHPRIDLDVSFDDRAVDLAAGGFDLGIRIGNLPDSALISRRLAPVRRALLASPAYVARHGAPKHPRDIEQHAVLTYANAGGEAWRFADGDGWHTVRGRGVLRADSGEMLRAAAVAGLGLVLLPTFIASPAIATGALDILLPGFPLAVAGLHAVMPPGRAATARVRALVDFLAARFGPEPAWDPCWLAERPSAGAVPAARPSTGSGRR